MKTRADFPIEHVYGHHLIITEEDRKRFGPKRETDEYYIDNLSGWLTSAHSEFIGVDVYRRPVDIGEGYELVPLNDSGTGVVEFTVNGKDWHLAALNTNKSIKQLFNDYADTKTIAYRRKKKTESVKEPSVVVAGRKIRSSNADFERACLVHIERLQDGIGDYDSAMLDTFCEAVRLVREYSDAMQLNNDCEINPISSRTCERGTDSCTVEHDKDGPNKKSLLGVEPYDPLKDGVDITEPVKNNWIPYAERLPKPEEYPVWVTDGELIGYSYSRAQLSRYEGKPGCAGTTIEWDTTKADRWQSVTFPPLPKKPDPFEEWFTANEKSLRENGTFKENLRIAYYARKGEE